MAKTVIHIENEKNQNAASVIRQFSRRVMSSGITRAAKKRRFFARNTSELTRKRSALVRLSRKVEVEKLLKLGKPLSHRKRRS